MKRISSGALAFALIWALACFLPPVREAARVISLWPRFLSASYSSPTQEKWTRPVEADPRLLEWRLEDKIFQTSHQRAQTLREFDALAARFPRELWIRAERVRFASWGRLDLNAENGARRTGATQLSPRQLKEAASVATQAERADPDNAFWPLSEAVFRFALGQKAPGVAAFERAGACSRFEDFNQSTRRARIQLWEEHDNPSWEEKTMVFYQIFFPQLTPFHDASKAASREALRARHNGQPRRAVAIEAAVLSANALLRRGSDSTLAGLVAEAAGRESLQTVLGVAKLLGDRASYPDERQKQGQSLARAWAAFARANGRSDLAGRAAWVAEPSVTTKTNEFWGQDLWAQFGLPAPQGQVAAQAPTILLALAVYCFALALVWLTGRIGARLFKRGASPQKQSESPTRGQIVACANFGFWALAGALLVAIRTGWASPLLGRDPFFALYSSIGNSSPLPSVLLLATLVLGCWLLPVAFTSWKRNRRFRWVRPAREVRALPRYFRRSRVFAWLAFFVFTFFVASNGRGLWDDTPFQLSLSVPVTLASLFCALVLEGIHFTRSGRTLPRLRLEGEVPPALRAQRALRLALSGSWLVAVFCFGFVLVNYGSAFDLPPLAAFSMTLVGLSAVLFALASRRKIERGDGFAFRLATRSAGVLSLVWSFVFLVAALAVWPLRVELNHQLDRRLAMREEDWIKEQLRKFPPDTPAR